MDKQAVGNINIAEVGSDLGGIGHRATHEGDFAAVIIGKLDGQLDAMNTRGEAGDEEPLVHPSKDFIKLAAHGALAGCVAGALDIGGVLKKCKHALFAILGEAVQVEETIVGGRGVNFEIAGVNDYPERRVNRERNAIHQAVRDRNGMNREGAKLETFSGADFVEFNRVKQFVLFEFVLDVGERELGAIHGHVDFGKNPGQAADVIFVAVSEYDGPNLVAILNQ